MAEQMPDRPTEKHPIAAGLIALVGVALVVGLILGLVVFFGARMMGLSSGADTASSGEERSMYLPRPHKTPTPSDPALTLAPGPQSPTTDGNKGDKHKPRHEKKPRKKITLSASTTSAGPMEQFDLTGVYPGGEGAILQVQRSAAGSWQDFPVTTGVSNETFSVGIQTSQSGVNRFRVVDTDTGQTSNVVRVTIG